MSKQLRFIYGSLLKQICEKIGVEPTRDNKEVVKAMLKAFAGVDSLGSLNEAGKSMFIQRVAILMASEAAIVIDLPGEDNVEEQDMKEFLKAIYR